MAKKELMGWIAERKTWQKRYNGILYTRSCRQLKAPPNKAASVDAANAWWEAKQKELDQTTVTSVGHHTEILNRANQWAELHEVEDRLLVWDDEKQDRLTWRGLSEEARAVWLDRIKSITPRRRSGNLDKLIAQFLDYKQAKVAAGQLSAGRWDNCRRYLSQWKQFIGNPDPKALDGIQLERYHALLLRRIAANNVAQETAKSNLSVVKEFYGWLHKQDVLDKTPKNLDDINITVEKKRVKTLPLDYIKRLLAGATDREKLYLLLMMNCGMTQGDISGLRQEEVNWNKGIIVRKRSKTKQHQGVPTVSFPIWRSTLKLLQSFHTKKGDYVLTNEDGGQLKTERITDDGKYTKTDNIAVAYYRLCKRLKIKQQPLKLIRKTSATLLRNSDQYSQFAVLFLGHSPRGIAETHYFGDAGVSFSDAIRWLAKQYGVE